MKPTKTLKNSFLLAISIFLCSQLSYAQEYKEMMNDNRYNFYDVVDEAMSYFDTIDVEAKGSGFKQFMRWAVSNEYKYYPSGNRLMVDPEFTMKAYKKNVKNSFNFRRSTKSSGWRELGPLTIGTITGHHTAGSGRILDFEVDPTNINNIYICSRSGGLWKTNDEGATWSRTSTEKLPATGVNSVAVEPSNFNHVYITLQNADNNYSYGIYESTDGGTSFNATKFNPNNLGFGGLGSTFRIYTIAHHPNLNNTLYLGTSRGLYKTSDNFNSWSKVISSGRITQIKFHPENNNVIYAYNDSSRNRVYISNNAGDSFSISSITENNGATAKIEVTPSAPNDVYFISDSGLFKSNDSGGSFSFVANSFDSIDAVGTLGFAVNSTNPENLLIGSVDLANSTDGGISFNKTTSWSLRSSNHGTGSIEERYFNSNIYVHADLRVAKSIDGVFYIGTDGTIAKSEDGGVTWTNLMLKNIAGIRENYKLGLCQSNNDVVICGSQDNGTSIKNASGWVEMYGADGMEGIILPLNPELMIGSIQRGPRLRTLNGGNSFLRIESNEVDGWWESPLAFDPNDQFKIYDFKNGVNVSTDFGLNYKPVGTPSFLKENPDDYWSQIRNAEIAQNNSNIMIVSGRSEIEKSIDGGITFFDIRNGLPNHEIEDIAFNPNNDDDIIVVNASYQDNNQKVYRSTNGGISWNNITFNIGDIPVHSVVIENTDNPNIYIGTEIGVYYKNLEGTTWTRYSEDLPNVGIQEIEINYGANTLKAATWGRGLWEFDLVNKAAFPSIEKTTITDPPSLHQPLEGNPQFVTSTINYTGTLSKVEVKYSVNNQLFDNVISMTNTSGNTWVSEKPIANETVDGDKVFFKVVASGSKRDSSETYKFMYEVHEFMYCESEGSADTGSDYINQIKLGDFVNNSGKNTYTLYDELDPIQLVRGGTYELSIKLAGAVDKDTAAAWIDFNNNRTFNDNELIEMSKYLNNISTGTFTVPEDAVIDQNIRMRTSNIFDKEINPCGNVFGEVEDYLIKIKEFPNVNPTVAFSNPSEDITLQEGYSSLEVNAQATDSDGSISSVQLFIDQVLVRELNQAPYQWGTLNNSVETLGLTVGNHSFTVIATDNEGATSQDQFNLTVTKAIGFFHETTKPKVRLYPNPTVNELSIQGLPRERSFAEIMDMNGRLVLSRETFGEETIYIDITDLSSATYILIIKYSDFIYSEKFVKESD